MQLEKQGNGLLEVEQSTEPSPEKYEKQPESELSEIWPLKEPSPVQPERSGNEI